MKNVYYTLSIMCLLLAFGCKKDKDVVVPEDLRTQIVGKWKIENVSYKVYIDEKEDTSQQDIQEGSVDDYIEFTVDGRITVKTKISNSSSTYSLNEEAKTLNIENRDYKIIEISKSKLVFQGSGTETRDGKSVREEVTFNLKK